jgi:hypothetical protein
MERERVIAGKRDTERVRKKDRGRGEEKERDCGMRRRPRVSEKETEILRVRET